MRLYVYPIRRNPRPSASGLPCQKASNSGSLWRASKHNIGALIIRIGFWAHYTIFIIRTPQNSIGTYLGRYKHYVWVRYHAEVIHLRDNQSWKQERHSPESWIPKDPKKKHTSSKDLLGIDAEHTTGRMGSMVSYARKDINTVIQRSCLACQGYAHSQ